MSEKLLQSDPAKQHMLLVAGYAYRRSGRRREAEAVIDKTQYVIPSFVAVVYGGMGEKDKAFAELDKAIEQRDSGSSGRRSNPCSTRFATTRYSNNYSNG